jgi:iron(III) transport system ATP-binding protein
MAFPDPEVSSRIMAPSPHELTLRELVADRRGQRILHGVSLDVAAGTTAALIGPSGSGKSTLLRCIAGLLRPTAGEIQIAGQTVFGAAIDRPPHDRRISMVFQSYALWPHLTVEEHLRLVARDPEAPSHWLARMQLTQLSRRLPGQLSGGEQARLALARALVTQPRVLLLDEPFRNLDPPLARDLQSLLAEFFAAQNLTVLLVTHDHREAFSLAQQVSILHEGHLIANDPPRELYRRPASQEAAAFLGGALGLQTHSGADGQVQTCLGPVEIDGPTDCPRVLVRPEDLVVEVSTEGSGVVVRESFEGHSSLLQVQVEDEHFVARVAADGSVRVGDRVQLRVRRALPPWPQPWHTGESS